ncbi:MAG: hypothetical protein HZA17_06470 [Nitrospirae bacterium]|nr:hypothetical protein [Nitrospirota bacterium]
MSSVRDIRFGNYCDRVYDELAGMKARLLGFVTEIETMKAPEHAMLKSHIPHFQDIIRTIEWKLEILTRVCPFEWSGYAGVEKTSSVQLQEEKPETEVVSGGYLGG